MTKALKNNKYSVPRKIFRPLHGTSTVLDEGLESEGAVIPIDLPCKRMIYSPTGPLSKDFDDVRSLGEAALKGIRRALKAGVRKPLLVLPGDREFKNGDLVILLGALEALYVPLQVREDRTDQRRKVQILQVWGPNASAVIPYATAVEEGRFVARDIGGGDPERMAPPRVSEYLETLFKKSKVRVSVINDLETLEKDYPLLAAVNRAASVIPRHQGCVVWLEYIGEGSTDLSLLLVGKGVTYDTGGADIKHGGHMAGMSRDKCGAAAIAGFFQTLNILRPRGINVLAALGMVRNSVGENGYVADELVVARSGARVRVGNTDAEGRMVMADLLCEMIGLAQEVPNPHLMTIATLTGHACLTVGDGYSIVMDNAVARKENHAQKLQRSAEDVGDPFEISTIRREDLSFHKGKCEGDDVFQCQNNPSSRTPRGHQGPAAFLMLASGLEPKHGLNSEKPLKYSHLDIAASSGNLPLEPTGSPILAMVAHYLAGRF